MPKYIVEREIPGAENLTEDELRGISQKSCSVFEGDVGAGYHWLQSFVAGDKIYCIHIAPNEEAVREHARQGAFRSTRSRRSRRSSIRPLPSVG